MISRRKLAAGFTLIELMISLAIGATVTGAGIFLYLQMSRNRNLVQAELNLQSEGYFIHQTLRQFINQAGYRPLDEAVVTVPLLPVKDLSETFDEVDEQWGSAEYFRVFNNGFAFRLEGASNAAGEADGSMVNCQGDGIAMGTVAEIQFSIAGGSMLCTSAGSDVEVIGEADDVQVEQFAISWGVDTNNDSSVDEYRDPTVPINTGERLKAIRLSLLLSSVDEVRNAPASYTFNGVELTSTDKRLRRESVTTVQLKH